MNRKQIKKWLDWGGDMASAKRLYAELPERLRLTHSDKILTLSLLRAIAFAWGKSKAEDVTPTLVKVKEALQGAHMDLEELAQGKIRDTVEEAGADVYHAVEVLDKITPEGT